MWFIQKLNDVKILIPNTSGVGYPKGKQIKYKTIKSFSYL